MKGFIALAVNRLADGRSRSLAHPLLLLLTYDEEIGTLGARRFSETWAIERRCRGASLSASRPRSGSCGCTRGCCAFASTSRERRRTAAIRISAGARSSRQAESSWHSPVFGGEMERERPANGEYFPEVPFAALNIGTVSGGSAANVIPDRCELQLGVRLLPGMVAEEMIERIREVATSVAGDVSLSLHYVSESPAMAVEENAAIYRQLSAELGQTRSESVMFASDAGWLQPDGSRMRPLRTGQYRGGPPAERIRPGRRIPPRGGGARPHDLTALSAGMTVELIKAERTWMGTSARPGYSSPLGRTDESKRPVRSDAPRREGSGAWPCCPAS